MLVKTVGTLCVIDNVTVKSRLIKLNYTSGKKEIRRCEQQPIVSVDGGRRRCCLDQPIDCILGLSTVYLNKVYFIPKKDK